MPCCKALPLTRDFPSAVLGPVLFRALARLLFCLVAEVIGLGLFGNLRKLFGIPGYRPSPSQPLRPSRSINPRASSGRTMPATVPTTR